MTRARAAAAALQEVLQGRQMYAMWCILHILYCQKSQNILRQDTCIELTFQNLKSECISLNMNECQAFYQH